MDHLAAIAPIISRHAVAGLSATALAGVSVMRSDRTSAPLGDVLRPSFALVAGGAKHTVVHGTSYRYGAGEYVVGAVDLPVVGHIVKADERDPFLVVVIDLRPDRIASLLLDTVGHGRSQPQPPPAAIGVSRASPQPLDAVTRLLTLLDEPGDVAALADGIEREILWRLLTGPHGATLRQIGTADSQLTHLAHAIHWIRDH